MPKREILNENSLFETTFNLEIARLEAVPGNDPEVKRTLKWMASRYGEGSYRNLLIAPTKFDYSLKHPTPTGEQTASGANIAHILGEEAVRQLVLWDYYDGWNHDLASMSILKKFPIPDEPDYRWEDGRFCCATCSMARLRAISAAKPKGYKRELELGLKYLSNAEIVNGRWKRFPFFYTLLTLRDLNETMASAVKKEVDKVRESAERAKSRIKATDSISTFRKLAVDWI